MLLKEETKVWKMLWKILDNVPAVVDRISTASARDSMVRRLDRRPQIILLQSNHQNQVE